MREAIYMSVKPLLSRPLKKSSKERGWPSTRAADLRDDGLRL